MKLPIYQIDAFAEKLFQGNPAAVCPLVDWLPEPVLQAIAAENNLAETAFYVANGDDYDLRWFTPTREVDLCGHATLAAAHVVFHTRSFPSPRLSKTKAQAQVTFHSKSGPLRVRKEGALLTLDFPVQAGNLCDAPLELINGLGQAPLECYTAMDYMAVYENEEAITSLCPDFNQLRKLGLRGVIATSAGDQGTDFVSRFFAPNYGINEDPVTGSAHCTLTPYWAERLKKSTMTARQLSRRTGTLECKLEADRVLISGKTICYLEGFIQIDT